MYAVLRENFLSLWVKTQDASIRLTTLSTTDAPFVSGVTVLSVLALACCRPTRQATRTGSRALIICKEAVWGLVFTCRLTRPPKCHLDAKLHYFALYFSDVFYTINQLTLKTKCPPRPSSQLLSIYAQGFKRTMIRISEWYMEFNTSAWKFYFTYDFFPVWHNIWPKADRKLISSPTLQSFILNMHVLLLSKCCKTISNKNRRTDTT